MKHTYEHLLKYYDDNEVHDYDESIRNDTYDDVLMSEIENHFNEEEMLHDLPTGVIRDMFVYYTTHKK